MKRKRDATEDSEDTRKSRQRKTNTDVLNNLAASVATFAASFAAPPSTVLSSPERITKAIALVEAEDLDDEDIAAACSAFQDVRQADICLAIKNPTARRLFICRLIANR